MVLKVKTLQISWHADEAGRNQPINGLDAHPSLPILATCSMDQKIHIWKFKNTAPPAAAPASGDAPSAGAGANPAPKTGPEVEVEFMFALTGHMRTVNAVRFSPNGAFLVSPSEQGAMTATYNTLPF